MNLSAFVEQMMYISFFTHKNPNSLNKSLRFEENPHTCSVETRVLRLSFANRSLCKEQGKGLS